MKKDLILVAVISAVVASGITVLASGPTDPFPDVDNNAYYTDSVYRMQSLDVVAGYANGNFGPNDPVTRGQIVTMLDRYDQSLLNNFPGKAVSGVYDLIQIVCDGGITFNIQSEGTMQAYERVCGHWDILPQPDGSR